MRTLRAQAYDGYGVAAWSAPVSVTVQAPDAHGPSATETLTVPVPITVDISGTGTGTSLAGDPRRFTGKERDAETALDYFGARYYRNVWGRFTSVDPIIDEADAVFDPQRWNHTGKMLNRRRRPGR